MATFSDMTSIRKQQLPSEMKKLDVSTLFLNTRFFSFQLHQNQENVL